jgi:hypothetical protein
VDGEYLVVTALGEAESEVRAVDAEDAYAAALLRLITYASTG